jgi:hypothetical protein
MADNTASHAAQNTVTNQHKKTPFVAGTTSNNIVASSSANTTTSPPNGEHIDSSNQRGNTREDAREHGFQYDSKAGSANNARGLCCRGNAWSVRNQKRDL